MRKKRKPSEQQRELFRAAALPDLEDETELMNDRLRDEFLAEREAREKEWRELEGALPDLPAEQPACVQSPKRPARPNVTKRLLARGADRERRKAAEREFDMLSPSPGRILN